MNRIILFLLFSILVVIVTGKSEPLSNCQSARTQMGGLINQGSCEYGAATSKTGSGKYTATINEYFYSSGAKCGDCFEVSGSNGKSVIVRVDSFCDIETCPSQDTPYFLLSKDAFMAISDDANSVIHDSSYRKVSCDAMGPLKGQFSNDSNSYYLKLLIFNNEVGISDVTIQQSGMKPKSMVRQNSAKFVWTNEGSSIKFPINITATSQYGGSITYQMKSLTKLDIFTFSSNFKVPSNIVKGAPEQCLLSLTPTSIYTDRLGDGWDAWSSSNYRDLNETTFENPANGTASVCIQLVGAHSALTLSRAGGFQTDYFTGIKFDVRANRDWDGFRVYFHIENWWTTNVVVNENWTSISIDFTQMKHQPIEKSISFGNEDNENVHICIDNIRFILNPNYKEIANQGGNGGVISTTTSGQSIGSSSENSLNSTSTSTTGGKSSESSSNHKENTDNSNSSSINQPTILLLLLSFIILLSL